MIHLGGGGRGCEPKSQVDRHCTYDMYMRAIFVVQRSKLCSFQREGRGSKYEMNDVRFRDDRKLLRRPLNKYNLKVQIIYKNARLSNSATKSSLTGPCCRKWVDPAAPRRRGRPKAACVACQSSEVECTRRNVVYRMTCKCSDKYVGETGRNVATRTKEHNDNSRNKTSGKALGEHYRLHHGGDVLPLGDSAFTEVCVLATESDWARRRICEAIQIRDTSLSINNNAGWDLL